MPRIWVALSQMIRETPGPPVQVVRWKTCPQFVMVLAWIVISLIGCSMAWGAGTPTQAIKETVDQVLSVLRR